ncbi:type VI secretion system protein TssA [Microbulbifer thermotolerans]|uniref:type VI secretion system protein TssA n=1 Tax=Microbulbifer thermotolerans TaxID=252514 RepID=UPI00224A88D4|nr:type VI secretion system protein TssA [Microbulbifer thermotolerans]MCX2780337.1 type VI secretion system protein TssA [Microbulbifer thermotolerans]MCX2805354.1 type VI secretion system protein TssA [Microbulbifer thermotolerans]
MPFPNTIDIDELIAPISDEQPSGSDIREDRSPTSDYYTIKDARNGARAAERSAIFDDGDTDLLAPWRDVAKSAEKILSGQSKDLEVASWYTEALIRLHGFTGLRDGFALIDRLVEDYWENLYPEPDEDGLETKVAPLTGLNGDGGDGTLLMPIRSAPITPEGDFGAYSFFQYQQARDADRIADDEAKAARIETLGYSLADIEQCVQAASNDWAQNLVETLEAAIAHYKSINEALRSHCGHDAPPSTNISTLLDEVLRTTRFIYKAQLEALAAASAESSASGQDEATTGQESTTAAPVAAAVTAGVAAGPVASREDALRLLEEAARYFRTYEPHTPLAPGLERLINWGRMTVSELMAELLPDEQSRAIYSQLTGVKLDGSDTQRYVAPPPVSSASAASPEPAQSAEPAPADDGWGGESKAEANAGW